MEVAWSSDGRGAWPWLSLQGPPRLPQVTTPWKAQRPNCCFQMDLARVTSPLLLSPSAKRGQQVPGGGSLPVQMLSRVSSSNKSSLVAGWGFSDPKATLILSILLLGQTWALELCLSILSLCPPRPGPSIWAPEPLAGLTNPIAVLCVCVVVVVFPFYLLSGRFRQSEGRQMHPCTHLFSEII